MTYTVIDSVSGFIQEQWSIAGTTKHVENCKCHLFAGLLDATALYAASLVLNIGNWDSASVTVGQPQMPRYVAGVAEKQSLEAILTEDLNFWKTSD